MEKRLAVKARFAEPVTYCLHLGQLLAFYSLAETQWASLLKAVLSDFESRRKSHLLANDIEALGGSPIQPVAVPRFTDTASALGAFYVLEGATLGGRHLLLMAERKLGISPQCGASYLASYGSRVDEMWRIFGSVVETNCQTPEARASAVAGARTTFLALEHWLVGALE